MLRSYLLLINTSIFCTYRWYVNMYPRARTMFYSEFLECTWTRGTKPAITIIISSFFYLLQYYSSISILICREKRDIHNNNNNNSNNKDVYRDKRGKYQEFSSSSHLFTDSSCTCSYLRDTTHGNRYYVFVKNPGRYDQDLDV